MAVPSDGSYGIKEGVVYSYPVTTKNGEYTIVQGLSVDEFSRKRMDLSRSRTARRARWREGPAVSHASIFASRCSPSPSWEPSWRHASQAEAAGHWRRSAIPQLEPQVRTLANGLRVYALPDPNTASVSVAVWYDVGSKNDPPGRSGFAHLFEHLMFKSTTNMPPETIDRLTEDVGGFNNASTADDFTNYYETVPANHLRARAVGRGRAHGFAGRRRSELQIRTRGGAGGVPPVAC